MRIYFDTEFFENGSTIDLISIGMIREDGAELYLENSEADLEAAAKDPWMKENVIKHLTGNAVPKQEIRQQILSFCGLSPVFYAYFASYDWVCLCQLFGRMIDLPKDWPMLPVDIKQLMMTFDVNKNLLPKQDGDEHNALEDARWNKQAHEWIRTHVKQTGNVGV